MYNTELFENILQSPKYSISKLTKTLVVCALVVNADAALQQQQKNRLPLVPNKDGIDDYKFNNLFSSVSSTWSGVKTSYAPSINDNISVSLNILKQLSFISVDAEAEKQADLFFSQKQFNTKKIIINKA